jgi:hypothetical protein
MLPAMSEVERRVLLAPGAIAKAASRLAPDPEQRWMLCQPAAVRRSYAEQVLGRPGEERLQEAWMLRQPEAVRQSFVEHVLARQDPLPRQEIWMLRQPEAVRLSYLREVLDPPDG